MASVVKAPGRGGALFVQEKLGWDRGPHYGAKRSARTGERLSLQAQYPPYHSKYNPLERVFGVLENYWRGDPLLSTDHALGLAANMTYKGVRPRTSLHEGCVRGVRLEKEQMRVFEKSLNRLEGLAKWFVHISPADAIHALQNPILKRRIIFGRIPYTKVLPRLTVSGAEASTTAERLA